MADRYISEKALIENIAKIEDLRTLSTKTIGEALRKTPTADVVEVETIKAWLYKIAINNVGYTIQGDFSDACEEIIKRLDGLRNFAKEKGGEK